MGLRPTPYFLFGVRKGSEKDITRLRRFFLHPHIMFFKPPIHRLHTVLLKKLIGLGKVSAPEKAVIRRKRAGVSGSKYQVAGIVNYFGFFSGVCAPEKIYYGVGLFIYALYYPVGKYFPALSPMAVRLTPPYREGVVQKEHSLFRPAGKLPVRARGNAQIRLQLDQKSVV